METSSINKFNRSVEIYNSTSMQKILKLPLRLPYSVLLPMLAEKLKIAIRVRAKTFWGDQMTLVFPESVSVFISRYGFFDKKTTIYLLRYLKPGMVFFDIGAHLGYFTLLASRLVGQQGQVHAFEPTPSTFKMLKTNISSKKQVTINNTAISSDIKVATFNDYGIKWAAFNSLYDARLSIEERSLLKAKKHRIQAEPLDVYIDRTGVKPDFVKIDAESAEYEILSGMEKALRQIKPIISLEVGDKDVEGSVLSKVLVQYLLDRGYQSFEIEDREVITHQRQDVYKYDNLLFVPT